jgi:hypothetical protein
VLNHKGTTTLETPRLINYVHLCTIAIRCLHDYTILGAKMALFGPVIRSNMTTQNPEIPEMKGLQHCINTGVLLCSV